VLYQINTRVWLTALARQRGAPATLDDVPDAELDRLQRAGFDWIWLLSVWQTGSAGRQVSRTHPEWRRAFEQTLPDLHDDDIVGSGFAITRYTAHADFGGDAALARLRERLRSRGLRLMLDFVPNHTGLDHHWIDEHPEYYVAGTETDLIRRPRDYAWVRRPDGDLLLAHGRDPNFAGWPDTLQLDYGNPATQAAMKDALANVAGRCDGVRCDMAMLVIPEVFERTWGISASPFWPDAIRRVRDVVPGFCLMAEAYWDMEWTLQQQGFDYAYDKRLYDRLGHGRARPVREHLCAGLDYQDKLARFLENHDEPRAAATFGPQQHAAAAVLTFLSPGLRFFHQGQLDGRRTRVSPHLGRAPDETDVPALQRFYERLLDILRQPAVRDGAWRLLECGPAFDGNGSSDAFIASMWQGPDGGLLLVAVNYAGSRGQCYVRLPVDRFADGPWRLEDLLSDAAYVRDGRELRSRGLYLDVPAWHCHVFRLLLA
jgi:glycosidase